MCAMKDLKKQGLSNQKAIRFLITLCLFIAVLMVFFALNQAFLSSGNIISLLRESAIAGIIAVGMTFVIITGGIDLSVGSNLALTAMLCANLLRYTDTPMIASVALSILCGTACGFLNGLAISKLKLPDFIVTLATMNIYRGLTKMISRNDLESLSNSMILDEGFRSLGGKFLGIYIVIWVFFILVLAGHLLLNHTRQGRYVFAIGSNARSAILSGINFEKTKILVYTFTGLMTAIAGVMICARMMTATTVTGDGMEFTVIAGVVLGGTSLTGGRGSVIGSFLGVLMITMISSGITQMGLPSSYQYIIKGVIILLAMLFDGWFVRKFSHTVSTASLKEATQTHTTSEGGDSNG